MNNDRGGNHRVHKDSDQAVVLTLRKRPSTVRRTSRQLLNGGRGEFTDADPAVTDPIVTGNPWEDTPSPPRRAQTTNSTPLNHRLSFDPASGVIMLPDNGDWLEQEEDSDEEDYGTESPPLQRSQTEPVVGGSSISTSPSTPSRLSRYGTYFHHPERRRQPIPGAFPR